MCRQSGGVGGVIVVAVVFFLRIFRNPKTHGKLPDLAFLSASRRYAETFSCSL